MVPFKNKTVFKTFISPMLNSSQTSSQCRSKENIPPSQQFNEQEITTEETRSSPDLFKDPNSENITFSVHTRIRSNDGICNVETSFNKSQSSSSQSGSTSENLSKALADLAESNRRLSQMMLDNDSTTNRSQTVASQSERSTGSNVPLETVSKSLSELAESNMRLSQIIYGNTESINNLSQISRQSKHSLTEFLDMIEDVEPKQSDEKKSKNQNKRGKRSAEHKDKSKKRQKDSKILKKNNLDNSKEKIIEVDLEHLIQLHKERDVGVYVLCDKCDKTRYLPDVKDPLDLPEEWYCCMNPDPNYNTCASPEIRINPEVEAKLIRNEYNAGSLVWAKLDGYPWWPAMVDDSPEEEDYFWLGSDNLTPGWYNVTFFDSSPVTRAWIRPRNLKPFLKHLDGFYHKRLAQYKARLDFAKNQALEASKMTIFERLKRFNFLERQILEKKKLQEESKPKGSKVIKKSKK
ncbi:zinc finger CW-type PWWP domain protein 1-like [Anthonomus grandis grandis]|uniref:zinc finger CW-type PWWP domain protein 1-like n=1 Tax=Anthonomus grandis grandis TaxID=2921223 RepID=UPI00216619CF|nr:zinc finger CW-type PWWP domain protein 1-like [Anthonomus grandis grandis]